MKAYSEDLRERVMAAVERKSESRERIAEVFSVSLSSIKRLVRRKRELGHVAALPHGGGQKPLFDQERLAALREEVSRHPDATLAELCQRVPGADGAAVSLPTMCRALKKLGFTRKKEGALGHGAGSAAARRPLGTDGGAAARSAPARLSR